MLGIVYLIFSFLIGYNILKIFLPSIFDLSKRKDFNQKKVNLPNWFVYVPGSFLVGIIINSWISYGGALLFYKMKEPLFMGNAITFILGIIFLSYCYKRNKCTVEGMKNNFHQFNKKSISEFLKTYKFEMIFLSVVTIFVSFLMICSFDIKGTKILIGQSVWSDFGPHLSVIRAFSMGANFPTQYPHFVDGNIKYHFMFQFLTGNLEYLGLRLDLAFNIPSIATLVFFSMLLYSFTVLCFGKKGIGVIVNVLLYFRSSFAFVSYFREKIVEVNSFFGDGKSSYFGYLKRIPDYISHIFGEVSDSMIFIGNTEHENWGLWNLNVYVNQRHLALSLAVLMLILIIMLPLLLKMIQALKSIKLKAEILEETKQFDEAGLEDKDEYSSESNQGLEKGNIKQKKWWLYLKEFLFKKDVWISTNIRESFFVGCLFGGLAFFNGAVVIGGLLILFMFALFSKRKLEFLNIGVITVLFAYVQTKIFIGEGNAVKPEPYLGFLSKGIQEDKFEILGKEIEYHSTNFSEIFWYLFDLLGLFSFIVILVGVLFPILKWINPKIRILDFIKKRSIIFFLAFVSPLVLAMTYKLTPDINANHKFIILSVILLNVFPGILIYKMLKSKRIIIKMLSISIAGVLMLSGLIDFVVLNNRNASTRAVRFDRDSEVTLWVEENTGSNETFLTEKYVLHDIMLAGRKIFYGHPYYAYSAGYDTYKRANIVKRIYGAKSKSELINLVEENNICYIVIDNDNRKSKEYKLNEKLINESYKIVFQRRNIDIYRTY